MAERSKSPESAKVVAGAASARFLRNWPRYWPSYQKSSETIAMPISSTGAARRAKSPRWKVFGQGDRGNQQCQRNLAGTKHPRLHVSLEGRRCEAND
jgi:hypothetical protein